MTTSYRSMAIFIASLQDRYSSFWAFSPMVCIAFRSSRFRHWLRELLFSSISSPLRLSSTSSAAQEPFTSTLPRPQAAALPDHQAVGIEGGWEKEQIRPAVPGPKGFTVVDGTGEKDPVSQVHRFAVGLYLVKVPAAADKDHPVFLPPAWRAARASKMIFRPLYHMIRPTNR